MANPIVSLFTSTPETADSEGSNFGGGHYELPSPNWQDSDGSGDNHLFIALIGANNEQGAEVSRAIQVNPWASVSSVSDYPSNPEELKRLLADQDIVVIDLDGRPEYALELVEHVSTKTAATVMVYSAEASPDKLMRSMRAGAREFLTVPIQEDVLQEALIRAAARRPANRTTKRAIGRLLTFMGAKGGVGVTTLACNFAIALAQQRDRKTLLIDLAIPLGDVALNLGLQSDYSTVNALQAADRLDSSFLAKLLVKHSAGLEVLPGPGKFVTHQFTGEAIAKLLAVARQSFDYVVVDAGSRLDLTEMSLCKEASTIYLVTQVGVAELRNSNRLISQILSAEAAKVEIVINRNSPRATTVPEDYIAKVLTKAPKWKVPNDYASVQRLQIEGTTLVPGNSPIAQVVQEMARTVTGQAPQKKKKGAFNFFG